jgi:hypothetical protein
MKNRKKTASLKAALIEKEMVDLFLLEAKTPLRDLLFKKGTITASKKKRR